MIGLIAWKKPTIPTFVAGIAVAAFLGMFLQDVSLKNMMNYMYSGFSIHTDSAFVDKMLNRGGFTSMFKHDRIIDDSADLRCSFENCRCC